MHHIQDVQVGGEDGKTLSIHRKGIHTEHTDTLRENGCVVIIIYRHQTAMVTGLVWGKRQDENDGWKVNICLRNVEKLIKKNDEKARKTQIISAIEQIS